jgi:3-methyladenine DNA glycosylase AlkD
VGEALRAFALDDRARVSASFFKTAPGQYGFGDQFLGVAVPDSRTVARRAQALPLPEIEVLLSSPWHEERLTALLVLGGQYERGSPATRAKIAAFYLHHLDRVNNWDLVDSSAWQILGREVRAGADSPLDRLARSPLLWERRVAMIATFAWIREGEAEPALLIASLLLDDREDLMHKAVGWMLREVGKRVSRAALVGFLETHATHMPRTALRYAIEHFSAEERADWLARSRSSASTSRRA